MPFDAPFRLGPFIVDPLGRLQPNAPEASPSVYVRWRNQWVTIRLEAVGADRKLGRLSLSAVIGRVRSTAGPLRPNRAQALETLRGLDAAMPAGWRMQVQPDHSARVETAQPMQLPATAGALVTAVTCFLLDLAPYLDLLAEPDAGFESVGAALSSTAGMVNT